MSVSARDACLRPYIDGGEVSQCWLPRDHAGDCGPAVPCPTPEKVAHPSEAAAAVAVKRTPPGPGRRLRAYQCPCGAWHVGHGTRRGSKGQGAVARRKARRAGRPEGS